MAWRDSRRSRARLLLFMASIILGIAALVGINSFGDNLAGSIADQARELLGADLVLTASHPFDPKLEPTLTKLGTAQSQEMAFASLVQFRPGRGVRLAQVRARSGGFFLRRVAGAAAGGGRAVRAGGCAGRGAGR